MVTSNISGTILINNNLTSFIINANEPPLRVTIDNAAGTYTLAVHDKYDGNTRKKPCGKCVAKFKIGKLESLHKIYDRFFFK